MVAMCMPYSPSLDSSVFADKKRRTISQLSRRTPSGFQLVQVQSAMKTDFSVCEWGRSQPSTVWEKQTPKLGPSQAYNTALMEGALPHLKGHMAMMTSTSHFLDSAAG